MWFFHSIRDSIYSPKFYKGIPKTGFGRALGYYFLLNLLLTIITVAFFIGPVTAGVKEVTAKIIPQVIEKYPADLQISIKNGQVSTNVEQPYMIALPDEADDESSVENLLVIDTTAPFSDAQFDEYSTVAILTKDHIYYRDPEKGEIRGQELRNIDDFTLDRKTLMDFVKQATPFLNMLTPLIIFFAFLFMYFLSVVRLITLLFTALIVFLVMKATKPVLTYSAAYKTVLYAITAALLVETFLAITQPLHQIPPIPFMATTLTVVLVLINYKSGK